MENILTWLVPSTTAFVALMAAIMAIRNAKTTQKNWLLQFEESKLAIALKTDQEYTKGLEGQLAELKGQITTLTTEISRLTSEIKDLERRNTDLVERLYKKE